MHKKILVVDDNRLMLRFFTDLLTGEGHTVKTCQDGLAALSLLSAYLPDIIFVDLVLPNIAGDTLCRVIRTMPQLQRCYLAIVSAVVSEVDLDVDGIGVNACIAKGPAEQMRRHVLSAVADAGRPVPSLSAHQVLGSGAAAGVPPHLRHMTRELLARNRHLVTILESMTEAIVEVGAGRVVYANPAAVRLFARPLQALLCATARELFDARHADRIDSLMAPGSQAPSSVGETHPMEFNGRQIVIRRFAVMGEADAVILLISDVTRQRELEHQLQHARRLDAIGNLAGGIAHNFNNLLMGIQGNLSILMQDKQSHDPGYDEMAAIERCVDSAAALTRQLLSFAKGGGQAMDPIDLNDVVERSAAMFARTHPQIRVQRQLTADGAVANVDALQIELALTDLYRNAWHAMPGGGTMTVTTAVVDLETRFVQAYGRPAGRYLKIEVADTGDGMDPETVQRAFEPFFTTRAVGQGAGLGLASVFGIVDRHGGIVTVDSRVGCGSTFTIYLPAMTQRCDSESTRALKKTTRCDGPGKRLGTILVVDDEPYILDANKAMLEALGYDVLLANGGAAALDLFALHQDRIDLLILDLAMPEMGGEDVYERIKTIRPKVRVILSSGYGVEGLAESSLKKGCAGFLQKPYTMGQLAARITAVLGCPPTAALEAR
jgi:signal transduction histidine kinase/DNA-binding response OmpR family regulator